MRLPTASYLIAGNQRSGTTLLCRVLADTGVAGRPDEYFLSVDEALLPEFATWERGPFGVALGATSRSNYVDLVYESATTANGVFGVKVMANNLPWLVEKARAMPGFGGLDATEVLQRLLPGLRVILMTREDRLAQAVSWARASQDQVWVVSEDEPATPVGEPEYDRKLIENLLGLITEGEAVWRARCDDLAVTPHEVRYEDLVADDGWEPTVGAVLDHLGLEVDPTNMPAQRTRRQADEINDAWIARFLAGD